MAITKEKKRAATWTSGGPLFFKHARDASRSFLGRSPDRYDTFIRVCSSHVKDARSSLEDGSVRDLVVREDAVPRGRLAPDAPSSTMKDRAIVYVVDDDSSVRSGLDSLLRSVGYEVLTFASADDFLAFKRPRRPSCLLLDIRMPGVGGMLLQERLRGQEDDPPVIFLTGHGDVALSVRAMKAGASDFFLKPFHEETLLEAIRAAVDKDRAARLASDQMSEAAALFDALTPREAKVIALVAAGLSSREIALKLSLAEITIKVNRANAMRKLKCRSVIELVHAMNVGKSPLDGSGEERPG